MIDGPSEESVPDVLDKTDGLMGGGAARVSAEALIGKYLPIYLPSR